MRFWPLLAVAALAMAAPGGATVAAPAPTLIAAGDVASCQSQGDEQTAKLLRRFRGTVAVLGDTAYERGTDEEFRRCYAPSGGRRLLPLLRRRGRPRRKGLVLVSLRQLARRRPQHELLDRRLRAPLAAVPVAESRPRTEPRALHAGVRPPPAPELRVPRAGHHRRPPVAAPVRAPRRRRPGGPRPPLRALRARRPGGAP